MTMEETLHHLQHPWAGVQVSVQPEAGFWKPSLQILQSGPIELPVHITRKLAVMVSNAVLMKVIAVKSLPAEISTTGTSVPIRDIPGPESLARTRNRTPPWRTCDNNYNKVASRDHEKALGCI